jgi:acetyltransferase-like isoleucine patch superfamily enzyme
MKETHGRVASLRVFGAENGWLLLARRVAGATVRRLRDVVLARRLKTVGLRLGRSPKLVGLAHMRVGKNFSAGNGLWLEAATVVGGERYEPLITISANVNFSDNVHVGCTHRVTIGEGTLSGSNVIITDHSHGRYSGEDQSSPEIRPVERRLSNDKSITIGRNVWLGDGVAVLGGADIGDGAIIGANSVVNCCIPAFCIAVGAPARPVRRWDAERSKWAQWTETE